MAKMTKSQAKKSIEAIIVKASKLFMRTEASGLKIFSVSDYIALDKILVKALKKLK